MFFLFQFFFTYLKRLKQFFTKISAPKYALFANENFFFEKGKSVIGNGMIQYYFEKDSNID